MKQMMIAAATLAFTVFAGEAMADRVTVSSDANVEQSVQRLLQAVEAQGARVFTTVNFQAGARSVDLELRPTTVVIFGSPSIGGQAIRDSQTLALYMPLRILFFEDSNGQTWATYDDPTSVAPTHGVDADNPAILRMQGALETFSRIATGR